MKTYQELLDRISFYEQRKNRLKSAAHQYNDDFSWSLDLARVSATVETLNWIKTLFETYKPRWDEYLKTKGGRFGRRKSDNIFYYIPEIQAEIKATVETKEAMDKAPEYIRDREWKTKEAIVRAKEEIFHWLYQDYWGEDSDEMNPSKFLRRWTDQLSQVPEFDVWSNLRKR